MKYKKGQIVYRLNNGTIEKGIIISFGKTVNTKGNFLHWYYLVESFFRCFRYYEEKELFKNKIQIIKYINKLRIKRIK